MTNQTKSPERLAGGHGPAEVWVTHEPITGYGTDHYLHGVNEKPWEADYDAPITTFASNEKYIRADLLEAAEAQLNVIEDWGTEEINAAVDLRQKLAQTRVELNAAKAENERLRAFIEDFASTDFEQVRPSSPPRHPADELDPVTDWLAIQAWQEDARAALAQKNDQY